ncbi:asparagine synthase-related protein [Amycolatopsis magusensis]|uniref:asparagine synthase (glutamine-hydrolyzing) n=1 Tax=Amycolatopsis magusensis TaxID=882444 RepID=A0ABS4Q1B9_9PSEU|nr:asparagine synthase-related protein [Amycolatopsis magusensis]MBP2185466.1 asparagine synthase (glutamine-hydrolyzing) [Amycolatopsis magusensis]
MILPDTDAALAAAAAFNTRALDVLRHPSGRPWLLGRWRRDDLALFAGPDCSVAIFGEASSSARGLANRLVDFRGLADADQLGARISGSYHLLVSVGGKVRAQGTLSGLRRVFHTTHEGTTLGCTRSDVLAELVDAAPDEELLAAQLMAPGVPYPLADQSVWRGVHSVPEDSYLVLDQDGRAKVNRRWTPPDPVLALRDGVPLMAEALSDAVSVRTQYGGIVSADLSGGMDSTSLCFCAERGPARLVTLTRLSTDPANDDGTWAREAAAQLDSDEHLFVHPDELPGFYAGLARAGEDMDEPVLTGRVRAEYEVVARWLRERGSRVHMSGEGGDQILQGRPSFMHTIVRGSPLTGLRHTRGYLAQNRWHWRSTIRALADNRSFGQWLADSAADLSPRSSHDKEAQLGWQAPPQLPPWVLPEAVDRLARRLRGEAGRASPLAPERAQHSVLWTIRAGARLDRHLAEITAAHGVPMSFPFYDDKVLEAALAVRLHERADPATYKPLLAGAMRGIVPDGLLGRSTKGEYGADVRAGLFARRDELEDLVDQPVLAKLGLIDADALRRACFTLLPPHLTVARLESTLLLECWLRAHTGSRFSPVARAVSEVNS